jgi:hypothetical protein
LVYNKKQKQMNWKVIFALILFILFVSRSLYYFNKYPIVVISSVQPSVIPEPVAVIPPPVSLLQTAQAPVPVLSKFDQVMKDIYAGKQIKDTPLENKDFLDQAANMVAAGKQDMKNGDTDPVQKETFDNTMWNKSTKFPFKK